MQCACTGKGLDITLCDFHARVLTARSNRLLIAANELFKKVSGIETTPGFFEPELTALAESLSENGVSQLDSASEVYKKKAHFLLRRAYDALVWVGERKPLPSAFRGRVMPHLRSPGNMAGTATHERWEKEVVPLLEELRKVFKPAT